MLFLPSQACLGQRKVNHVGTFGDDVGVCQLIRKNEIQHRIVDDGLRLSGRKSGRLIIRPVTLVSNSNMGSYGKAEVGNPAAAI
jgi:hypothetical protein